MDFFHYDEVHDVRLYENADDDGQTSYYGTQHGQEFRIPKFTDKMQCICYLYNQYLPAKAVRLVNDWLDHSKRPIAVIANIDHTHSAYDRFFQGKLY